MMRLRWVLWSALAGLALMIVPSEAVAQIDRARAQEFFDEAKAMCTREAGRVWGVSLCGPIVIADPVSKDIVTNEPAPDAPRPAALGFANAAMPWGGRRWTTLVWPIIAAMPAQQRRRLIAHELFHRVQPELRLLVQEVPSLHLDSADARYWLRLEWRALAAALGSAGQPREQAIGDALAFRKARQALSSSAAASEQSLEMNEGLAQYTGTIVAIDSVAAAEADAIVQLREAEQAENFVRTFAYPTGAAYGLLLEHAAPGWPRRVTSTDDLSVLLATATGINAPPAADAVASRYGAADVRASEDARATMHRERVAALVRRYVEGQVLRMPNGNNASFSSQGVVSLPGEGLVYPRFRVTAEWGQLQADEVLLSIDRARVTVAGPLTIDGKTIRGSGWTLQLSEGWRIAPGARDGEFQVERVQRVAGWVRRIKAVTTSALREIDRRLEGLSQRVRSTVG